VKLSSLPELALSCWNVSESLTLSRREAYDLYEAKWTYLDQGRLKGAELSFFESLIDEFGPMLHA